MKTLDYTPELFAEVMEAMEDYHQTAETVCGAEDPAVITLRKPVEGFNVVRVINRFVSPWKSDTFLEFSDRSVTPEEYALHDAMIDELIEG